MSKKYPGDVQISIEEAAHLQSVLSDVVEGNLAPLDISSAETEIAKLRERQQHLIRRNPGPITQWPQIEQDKWNALSQEEERLFQMIREMNPSLCT